MPRKAADPEADCDYDPYDSFEDERRVRQRTTPEGHVVRSSRGRPVKVIGPHALRSLCSANFTRACVSNKRALQEYSKGPTL